jgi:hypothetical protein
MASVGSAAGASVGTVVGSSPPHATNIKMAITDRSIKVQVVLFIFFSSVNFHRIGATTTRVYFE